MSYLVLARKWRPQAFKDIVGQEHVTRTLENAINSDRVAHAYLFTGARGVGKTSAARILAKALNCVDGPTTTPCDKCPPCKEITAGTAVDVQEIDGASNTSVDDIRELKESINYLPALCRKKIYIIDEVHMLSTSAFNALLKTLEEPPSHVIFIFATTDPHKIPGTILSRCQRFDFKRIPVKLIFERLQVIVREEGVEVSDEGLMVIAREADGGMRDAQSLLDQVISFSGKSISADDIVDVLGVIDRALIQETAAAVIARDGRKCLEIVDRLFTFGWDVKIFGRELLEYFRNLAVIKVAPGETGLIEATDDEIEIMAKIADGVSAESLHLYFDVMSTGMDDMARSFHPKVSMEMLLLKLSSLSSLRNIDEVIALLKDGPGIEVEREGAAPLSMESEPPVNETPRAVSERPQDTPPRAGEAAADYVVPEEKPTERGDDWNGFVTFVKSRKGSLGTILEHAHLINFDGEAISFSPENDFSFEKANDEKETLSALAKEYLGGVRNFDIQPPHKAAVEEVNSVYEDRKKKESDLSRKLKKEAMEHPVVTETLSVFGGTIKEIKTELNFNE